MYLRDKLNLTISKLSLSNFDITGGFCVDHNFINNINH